jgi:hypothetical protein
MSDGPAGEKPLGGKGRRRAPTIDLAATEVAAKQQATKSPDAERAEEPEAASLSSAHPANTAQPEEAAQVKTEPVSQNEQAGETAQQTATSSAEAESVPPSTTKSAAKMPWVFIGAGVVGAAVAAIVLIVGGLYLGRDMNALDARVADLEQQISDPALRPLPPGTDASTLNDLAGRVTKLETAIANLPTSPSDPAFANRIAGLEGQLKALSETVGILGRRNDEAGAAARDAKQRAEATAAALAELTQKLNRPVERGEFDSLTNQLTAVERAVKTLEAEAAKRPPSNDSNGRLAIAATVLNTAVERGGPFVAELAAVKSLGGDPKLTGELDAFAGAGVPSTAMLARELLLIIPALRESVGVTNHGGSFLEKLQASAEKLVRVRPLEAASGGDSTAILERIEFRASQGDVAGALAELANLPPAARAPAEAWIKRAQTRANAVESSRRIEANALASLSK